MPVENEQPFEKTIRLSDTTAEGLLEIAHGRRRLLDGKTFVKILDVLQGRLDSLDDDDPALGDAETALMQVYSMYLEMSEGVDNEGKTLKKHF